MPGPAPKGAPTVADFLARSIRTPNGCLEWTGATTTNGYGIIARRIDKRTRHFIGTRVVLAARLGRPLGPDEHALHRCDNPPCLDVDHLFLGDPQTNMRDMMSKGRGRRQFPVGRRNPNARLSDEDVAAIKTARAAGVTTVALAATYGIHHSGVSRIARGLQRNGGTR